jgi:hypothetical protein
MRQFPLSNYRPGNKLNNWEFYFKLSNRNPRNDMNFQLVGANQLVHWFLGGKGLGTQEGTSVWVGSPTSFQPTSLTNNLHLPTLIIQVIALTLYLLEVLLKKGRVVPTFGHATFKLYAALTSLVLFELITMISSLHPSLRS